MNIKSIIFREALAHSRNPKVVREAISRLSLMEYKDKSFKEIVEMVNITLYHTPGIGKLTRYDIIAALARLFKVHISHIYIVGNGPKKAIQQLKLTHKLKQERFGRYAFKYIEKKDLIEGLKAKGYATKADEFEAMEDMDSIESQLCVFSRTKA